MVPLKAINVEKIPGSPSLAVLPPQPSQENEGAEGDHIPDK